MLRVKRTWRDKDKIKNDDEQIMCEIVLRGGDRSDSRGEETSLGLHTHAEVNVC